MAAGVDHDMGNVLARAAAVGLVAGGFAITGDLAWLADRGRRLLEARDIPGPRVAEADSAAGVGMPIPAPQSATASPQHPRTMAPLPPADPGPPADGPPCVALRSLPPGGRLVLWIGPGVDGPARRLLVDVVDPPSGAAVVVESAAGSPDGPPRRVLIQTPGGDAIIARGGSIQLVGTGLAGDDPGPWLGPITAIGTGP